AGFDLRGFALRDEVAAGVACPGPKVHHEIGAADGVFVVLNDQDGIAEIAEMFERAEEARIVSRVQADAGFVENIENATKSRADLRGQADALGFSAGKRGGRSVRAEITTTDGKQEIDAPGDICGRTRGEPLLAFGALCARGISQMAFPDRSRGRRRPVRACA